MSAAVEQALTAVTSTNVTNLDLSVSGITEGNLLIMVISADGLQTISAITYDSGIGGSSAGFTSIGSSPSSSYTLYAYYKTAVSGDMGSQIYNVELSGAEQMVVSVVELSSHDGLDGTPGFFPNAADSTPDSPSITTSVSGARILSYMGIETAGGTIDAFPYGNTVFNVITTGAAGTRLGCDTEIQATAGATGTETWTVSSTFNSVGLTIGVKAIISSGKSLPGSKIGMGMHM